jgi:hypothetical protein
MATGIDVFFAGLMLICFDKQPSCPVDQYNGTINTAWVVKADGPQRICGRNSPEKARLELKFDDNGFDEVDGGKGKYACKTKQGEKKDTTICTFLSTNICLTPSVTNSANSKFNMDGLLRFDEVDRRLLRPDESRLKSSGYVSARINFPAGIISAGELWPYPKAHRTRWYRSDSSADETLPRALSDRLKISYSGAKTLALKDCTTGDPIVTFKPKNSNELTFQNITYDSAPTPEYDDDEGYDILTYLCWYYNLGEWDTPSTKCPLYDKAKNRAVMLRCVAKSETGCAYDASAKADSRFWPVMLGPKKE